MTNNRDDTRPTDTDFAAWRAAEDERNARAAEAEREAAKWRDRGDLVVSPAETDPARVLMYEALRAMTGLSLMRGTRAAEMAREVAMRALFALGSPDDPSEAAAVKRMHRSIHGAESRGDRQVIYEIAYFVESGLVWRATGGKSKDRAPLALRDKLASLWPDRAGKLAEADLANWLDSRLAQQIQSSGVVARILVAMQWFGADPLPKVTKRVDEALRAAKVRAGEHVPQTKKRAPKKRAKHRK